MIRSSFLKKQILANGFIFQTSDTNELMWNIKGIKWDAWSMSNDNAFVIKWDNIVFR